MAQKPRKIDAALSSCREFFVLLLHTMQNADIFFFISSIGFVIVFIIFSILLYYIIKAIRSFTRLMERIETNVDDVGFAGRELIEDMRDSAAFRLLFRPRKK